MKQKNQLQFNKETVEVLDHLESNNVLGGGDDNLIIIGNPELIKTKLFCPTVYKDCDLPGATKSCDALICIPF